MRAICPTLDLVEDRRRRFFSLFFPILNFSLPNHGFSSFPFSSSQDQPIASFLFWKEKLLIFSKRFLLVIIFAKNCTHRHLLTLRLNRMKAVFFVSVLLEIQTADDWVESGNIEKRICSQKVNFQWKELPLILSCYFKVAICLHFCWRKVLEDRQYPCLPTKGVKAFCLKLSCYCVYCFSFKWRFTCCW